MQGLQLYDYDYSISCSTGLKYRRLKCCRFIAIVALKFTGGWSTSFICHVSRRTVDTRGRLTNKSYQLFLLLLLRLLLFWFFFHLNFLFIHLSIRFWKFCHWTGTTAENVCVQLNVQLSGRVHSLLTMKNFFSKLCIALIKMPLSGRLDSNRVMNNYRVFFLFFFFCVIIMMLVCIIYVLCVLALEDRARPWNVGNFPFSLCAPPL